MKPSYERHCLSLPENPVSVEVQSVTDGLKVKVNRVPDGVAEYSVWGLKLPTLRQRLFRCVSIRENDDGTYAITAVQHVPEKEAIVDNGAHFDGDQSGTVNGVTPPAVQHLTAEVTADSGEYQVLARWDTPKVVKGVSFLLRLTVAADDGSERLVSTARTTETTYRFTQLAPGNYRLTVRAVNAWGQQGDPASVSFRIAAPAVPSRLELTPGYFQITATPHLAVYDPTVQFEFWFSEKRIADIRQVETTARYLGTALYWIAASINIRPGHNYYFYVRSVNTVGKSAFVEAVGQPSDDASGYLDFFKGEIGKTHLAQELWTQIDNGQLAPDLAEIRTSITDVSNEITQTVNKKLEDQSAAIQQIQKVQVDTNNNLNSMWAVKLQQMQDGRLYIAGKGRFLNNINAVSKTDFADKRGMRYVRVNAPAGATSGKYYPVVVMRSAGSVSELASRVIITTATRTAGDPMNNCEFNGFVMPGGWTDRGRYAYGMFWQYQNNERAIHSIMMSN